MATQRTVVDRKIDSALDPDHRRIALMFYVFVPVLTALLFGLNRAGMARLLPSALAIPYWLGLSVPLWLLLDVCSRALHRVFRTWEPHRWLVLLGGSLIAMAIFSPYVSAYGTWFGARLPAGTEYHVNPPFPEAFLDLRRFVAYSGVPIYWIGVTLFFVSFFRFPAYLVGPWVKARETAPVLEPIAAEEVATSEYGLPLRRGFRALLPYHLGDDLVSLSSEDHYVRVVTDRGNTLVRYRFADALQEVATVSGIQIHRSHWVAVRAVERVSSDGKGYRIRLSDGSEFPVSRTNVGVIRAAGLLPS